MARITVIMAPKSIDINKVTNSNCYGVQDYIHRLSNGKSSSLTWSAGCREIVTRNYSNFLKGFLEKVDYKKVGMLYNVRISLTASLRNSKHKTVYLNSMFKFIAPEIDKYGIKTFRGSSEVYTGGSGTTRVTIHNLVDPWKVSSVLYVLKYGTDAFSLCKERQKESFYAAKEYIGNVLISRGHSSTHTKWLSAFGLYLISKRNGYGLDYLNEPEPTRFETNGPENYFTNSMYRYLEYFRAFCKDYQKFFKEREIETWKSGYSLGTLYQLISADLAIAGKVGKK